MRKQRFAAIRLDLEMFENQQFILMAFFISLVTYRCDKLLRMKIVSWSLIQT